MKYALIASNVALGVLFGGTVVTEPLTQIGTVVGCGIVAVSVANVIWLFKR